MVHIMDGLVVSPVSGRMLQWDAAGEDLSEAGRCDAGWLALLAQRDPDWDDGSRLLWAAETGGSRKPGDRQVQAG